MRHLQHQGQIALGLGRRGAWQGGPRWLPRRVARWPQAKAGSEKDCRGTARCGPAGAERRRRMRASRLNTAEASASQQARRARAAEAEPSCGWSRHQIVKQTCGLHQANGWGGITINHTRSTERLSPQEQAPASHR